MYTSKDKVKKKKRKHSDSDSSTSDDELAISAPLPKKVQTHQRWSTKDYHILLERVEKEIPPDDKASYSTRNHKLNWDKIAFGHYTSEECKKTWFFLTAKIRKYRLLEEIATDVRHWINKNGLDPRNHPDYPRRPLNAYFFMCQDKRPELLEEFPDSTNQEIAKKCGQIYRHLSPKELEKYSKLSRKDSAKIKLQIKHFYKQHPEYNKSVDKDASDRKPRKPFEIFLDYEQENNPNYTNRDGALQTWSEMLDEDRLFWINWAVDEFNKYKETHKEARNVVLSKQEKEIMAKFTGQPEKPPLTAFHLFIKMMSKSEEFKALNHREKMGTIANIWKNSSVEDQEQYRIRLKQMRERYEKEFYEYLQTLSPTNRLKVWTRANMMRSKPNKSNVKNDEPVKIKSAVKKTKTELIGPRDEPKAPPSSCYRFFLKNWRGEEDPKIAWGRLGGSEKARWEEKWTESKKEFIANYELYLRTLSRRELENLAKSGNVLLAKNKDEGGANPNLTGDVILE